jgi:hypothetical protein
MSIVPVASSISPPPIRGSPPVDRGEANHPDSTESATSTSAASAALVSSKLTPARSLTPTLPPGVLFVEEPSGIKIYVDSKLVNPTEAAPTAAIAHEEAN